MSTPRRDLGALLYRLANVVIEHEIPVLRELDIEMWDYAVLGGLEYGAAPTQTQLAGVVGRDKTRLIPILDRLESRGMLRRTPDPADRRNRVVELTEAGRSQLTRCRAAIRALEDELLAELTTGQRASLLATLEQLLAHHRPES